jgi:hypothetical protein
MRIISGKVCRENQNKSYMQFNIFPKIVTFWDKAENFVGGRHVTDNNIILRMRLHGGQLGQKMRVHTPYV